MFKQLGALFALAFALPEATSAETFETVPVDIGVEGRTFSEFDGRLFETVDDMIFEVEGGFLKSVQPKSVTKWPGGILPIAFSQNYPEADKAAFWDACKWWSMAASVSCVPRANQTDYVFVEASSTTNSSYVGKIGGGQKLKLANRQSKGIIAHELAHALGFSHQHNAPTRDSFVGIVWNNIKPGKEHNFKKIDEAFVFGGYDFCSIMHYRQTAFSKNGQDTITLKVAPPSCQIGQRSKLSNGDKLGMAGAYGQDSDDEQIAIVPDLIGAIPPLFDTDRTYSEHGVRTQVISGRTRGETQRHTNCEMTIYTPRVVWQLPEPGEKVPFGVVVSLKTETDARSIFHDPPQGQVCQ